ncbi:hypothetical protein [Stenoxybacter acetivorans]|nr:hypothetical protein [Stenoxybacter acetivorans]
MPAQTDKERVYALLKTAISNMPEPEAKRVTQWLNAALERNFDE